MEIIGRSPALTQALELVDRLAPTPLPILIVGATGTGKELFARRIHARSGRPGPLVPVNCAALPRDMVESLLFGHRRGAFTGAVSDAAGFLEAAGRGTLYLDELSSLPFEAQGKLLRALEAQEVFRLGETHARTVDLRVVASGPEDLSDRVRAGTFRLDLYQRIAGVVLALLPLRQRPEDLLPLAKHFASLHGESLAPGVIGVLRGYRWPGNVRELRAVVERASFLTEDGMIAADALVRAIELGAPSGMQLEPDSPAVGSSKHRAQLLAFCHAHGYKASGIALALGLGLSTLYRHLQAAGISLRALRNSHVFSENSRED